MLSFLSKENLNVGTAFPVVTKVTVFKRHYWQALNYWPFTHHWPLKILEIGLPWHWRPVFHIQLLMSLLLFFHPQGNEVASLIFLGKFFRAP